MFRKLTTFKTRVNGHRLSRRGSSGITVGQRTVEKSKQKTVKKILKKRGSQLGEKYVLSRFLLFLRSDTETKSFQSRNRKHSRRIVAPRFKLRWSLVSGFAQRERHIVSAPSSSSSSASLLFSFVRSFLGRFEIVFLEQSSAARE